MAEGVPGGVVVACSCHDVFCVRLGDGGTLEVMNVVGWFWLAAAALAALVQIGGVTSAIVIRLTIYRSNIRLLNIEQEKSRSW